MMRARHIQWICLLLATLLLSACASQKNTSSTRWWKSFKSRYNTFFNGKQAYIEGMQAKMNGNKDNYSDVIPLMMVSNRASRAIGRGQLATTVTKCEKTITLHSIKTKPELKRGHKLTPKEKAFRNRKEFNPFLKNAWILMGKAQMEQGEFLEAASTFAYTERLYQDQPLVANIARSLMALCYTELDWYYDAEELLNKVRRDSIPRTARRPYNTAMTNYYLRQKMWQEALPYLEREVDNLPHGIPKARGAFLLGQVYKQLDMKTQSYKAFQRCLRQSPPYELRFNAEIMQTEVMPKGDHKRKLSKLNRMARKPNNKNYVERVYYAMGNVYMAIPDTVKAIQAYETGVAKATQNSMAKGTLLVSLGDLYWTRQRFGDARHCYSAALSMIDKEHERSEELNKRSKILDQLAPYTDEIFLQDSVQALVRMPEKDRLAAIDKLIEMEKLRRKALEKQRADSIANSRAARGGGGTSNRNNTAGKQQDVSNEGGVWYFYNPKSVMQGKEQFQKQWGKQRKNEDNWRRSTKDSVIPDGEDGDTEVNDSIKAARALADSLAVETEKAEKLKAEADSAAKNPLKREYYLAQLPFTEEQMAESNAKIEAALLPAGIIMKDQLENYELAQATLRRLYENFPEYENKPELLYHLFLLELHWGIPGSAEVYRNELATNFPDNAFAKLITAPDYEENARYGRHLEDSIYRATYEAYRQSDYATIKTNCEISADKYPQGENRPRFMFLDAMNRLHDGNIKEMTEILNELTTKYSKDPISELAASIVSSIKSGRRPGKDGFDMSSLWSSRSQEADEATLALLQQDSLTADRLIDFVIVLPYSTDTINDGKLLYEVSRFNFTKFSQRSFDIEILQSGKLGQLRISGFYNFDEAHRYVQELFTDSASRVQLKEIKPIIISAHNLQLVGLKYTIEEYLEFYNKNFVPSEVKEELKLDNNPDNFIWDEFQEVDDEESDDKPDKTDDIDIEDDGGEWY